MNSKSYWPDQAGTNLTRALSNMSSRTAILNAAVVVLLLAGILLPRVVALDRLVTPDEIGWLIRSGNFYYTLTRGNFADTYQIEHPGVLTMWAGMLAFIYYYPAYSEEATGQMDSFQDELGPFLRSHGYDPLDLLVASRLNMIIGIALVLMAAFWAASRLLGFWPAMIGFLLIAMDPFHTAISRLLHVDGLPSTLVLLSLLALLNYLYRGKQKRHLILSGIAAGLAWLTKSPMFFLIPFVGLMVLFELVEKWRNWKRLVRYDLWQAVFPLVLWGSIGLAVYVLLWPAMWVDPILTLLRVVGGMASYAIQGHEASLYFNGQIYTGDPGAHFYPITFLWRTTPVVLLGLILTVLALAFPQLRLIPSAQRRPLGSMLLFTVLFTLFMTVGAKKFDRYLLPIYLPIDLMAGVGWFAAVSWVCQQQPQRLAQAFAPLILLFALAGQAACILSSYPYYLSYYNPMLGGTSRAPEVMMVGWGEGLDQAAHFLNKSADAGNQQVATGVWTPTFSYFYKGPVVSTRFEPGANAIEDWKDSDYYILYINEKQRQKVSYELMDYLGDLHPIQVVRINGLDYVYVYDIRGVPPPDFLRLYQEN